MSPSQKVDDVNIPLLEFLVFTTFIVIQSFVSFGHYSGLLNVCE